MLKHDHGGSLLFTIQRYFPSAQYLSHRIILHGHHLSCNSLGLIYIYISVIIMIIVGYPYNYYTGGHMVCIIRALWSNVSTEAQKPSKLVIVVFQRWWWWPRIHLIVNDHQRDMRYVDLSTSCSHVICNLQSTSMLEGTTFIGRDFFFNGDELIREERTTSHRNEKLYRTAAE